MRVSLPWMSRVGGTSDCFNIIFNKKALYQRKVSCARINVHQITNVEVFKAFHDQGLNKSRGSSSQPRLVPEFQLRSSLKLGVFGGLYTSVDAIYDRLDLLWYVGDMVWDVHGIDNDSEGMVLRVQVGLYKGNVVDWAATAATFVVTLSRAAGSVLVMPFSFNHLKSPKLTPCRRSAWNSGP
ncbi:hypothetical protein VNO78_12388 [Psophocarpus tetragonolobus]|uniref:Uncharacterized protein n=1 Tax=Psophocarpus tetragonolobus TaxID=3891 RepID=A0AAN9SQV8_PSOTE